MQWQIQKNFICLFIVYFIIYFFIYGSFNDIVSGMFND